MTMPVKITAIRTAAVVHSMTPPVVGRHPASCAPPGPARQGRTSPPRSVRPVRLLADPPQEARSAMPLGSFDRKENLARLSVGTYDVLVVGGGITGAGVALDAASRGLRTALVERDDFASGTSSKSSKLVHGGLRYLQNGDVRLVYEALRERQRLLR